MTAVYRGARSGIPEPALTGYWAGAPVGFQARVGKIRREAPKNFFRLPTLVFSLPTLPYVTVAHPAHRTEADLSEKASFTTNQEGPLPSHPSDHSSLTVRPSYTIHTPGLWLQENGNISTLSCVTSLNSLPRLPPSAGSSHIFTVSHIHTVA